MRWAYLPVLLVLVAIYAPVRVITACATRADRYLDRQWRRAWYLFETGGGR